MQQVHKFKDEDNQNEDIYLEFVVAVFLFLLAFLSFIHHPEARQADQEIPDFIIQLLFPLIFC